MCILTSHRPQSKAKKSTSSTRKQAFNSSPSSSPSSSFAAPFFAPRLYTTTTTTVTNPNITTSTRTRTHVKSSCLLSTEQFIVPPTPYLHQEKRFPSFHSAMGSDGGWTRWDRYHDDARFSPQLPQHILSPRGIDPDRTTPAAPNSPKAHQPASGADTVVQSQRRPSDLVRDVESVQKLSERLRSIFSSGPTIAGLSAEQEKTQRVQLEILQGLKEGEEARAKAKSERRKEREERKRNLDADLQARGKVEEEVRATVEGILREGADEREWADVKDVCRRNELDIRRLEADDDASHLRRRGLGAGGTHRRYDTEGGVHFHMHDPAPCWSVAHAERFLYPPYQPLGSHPVYATLHPREGEERRRERGHEYTAVPERRRSSLGTIGLGIARMVLDGWGEGEQNRGRERRDREYERVGGRQRRRGYERTGRWRDGDGDRVRERTTGVWERCRYD